MLQRMSQKTSPIPPETRRRLSQYLSSPDTVFSQIVARVDHERLNWSLAEEQGLEVFVRRDDRIDLMLSGNKFYKLHGHYLAWRAQQQRGAIASFGGAWSNHLYALAALGHLAGIPTMGFIRGEKPVQLSPTLRDVQAMGMRLCFISRQAYRRRHEAAFLSELERHYALGEGVYWVPEGGAGKPGLLGCEQLGACLGTLAFDDIVLACGTGTTLLGLLKGVGQCDNASAPRVTGVPVLKAGLSIALPILFETALHHARFRLLQQFHCGGYARVPEQLDRFVNDFHAETDLAIEPVYTGKVFWALAQLIQQRRYARGSRILVLHTGGMQGQRTLF